MPTPVSTHISLQAQISSPVWLTSRISERRLRRDRITFTSTLGKEKAPMAYHEPMSKPKILVVGGGFGGIKAALELSKGDNSKFDITLVSDQANFRYYPALYR